MATDPQPARVDQVHLGGGFSDDDRGRVLDRLAKLNRRLRRFPADATELRLSVKERDSPAQVVTLECRVPKFPAFIARSSETDLATALNDVRNQLWRQLDDQISRRSDTG